MRDSQIRRHQAGFSLIELAMTIVVIGIVISVLFALVPRATVPKMVDQTRLTLQGADRALVSHAKAKYRLPCPDVNNDGLGDCGQSSGLLPYRDLGYAAPVVDASSRAIRYAVYRQVIAPTADDADLALAPVPNRFVPLMPLGTAAPLYVTDLEFCRALLNSQNAVASTSFAYVDDGGNTANVAFILASSGPTDADADNVDGAYDGLNEGAGVGFDSPARILDSSYDDLGLAKSFVSLAGDLSCVGTSVGVNSMSILAIAAYHQQESAQMAKDLADFAVVQHDGAILQAAIGTADAIFNALVVSSNASTAAAEALLLNVAAPVASAAAGVLAATAIAISVANLALVIAKAVIFTDSAADAAALLTTVTAAKNTAITRALKADQRGGTTL